MYDLKKSIDSSYGFKDPCESSPCLHSGHCLVFNAKSGFTCSCSRGYTGKLCEISKTNKFTWENETMQLFSFKSKLFSIIHDKYLPLTLVYRNS